MLYFPRLFGGNVAAHAGAAGVWVTSYSVALNIDSANWNGNNLRQFVNSSQTTESGSKVRLTLQAGSGAEGAAISEMYIGHAAASGDSWDFDGGQVQVTVGGLTAFTVPAASEVVTDEITFAFDDTKHFLIACHFNNSSHDTVRGRNATSSVNVYFKAAASEVSVSDVTGYSTTASAIRLTNKIEVLQP